MTTLDSSICWAVLVALPVSTLRHVAEREWERDFPHAIDPPPWETVPGRGEYAALVSDSPGSEGADRHFAEILSTLVAGKPTYSLWLDPERQHVFVWEHGRQIASRQVDPLELAESLGFEVGRPETATPAPSVAVVEGASLQDVRQALADLTDLPWIHLTPGPAGVLVTADEGPLGTQAWEIAEALPAATVYYVRHRLDPVELTVLVLRGPEEIGRFRAPALDDDSEMLTDVKGARAPDAILAALGIPPETLNLG
jgi:hypothetical protein